MELAVVFKRPDAAPTDDADGRITQGRKLFAGQVCRWCGSSLISSMRGRPASAIAICPRCDAPIGGDNTMLKFDDDSLDQFLRDWWKNA